MKPETARLVKAVYDHAANPLPTGWGKVGVDADGNTIIDGAITYDPRRELDNAVQAITARLLPDDARERIVDCLRRSIARFVADFDPEFEADRILAALSIPVSTDGGSCKQDEALFAQDETPSEVARALMTVNELEAELDHTPIVEIDPTIRCAIVDKLVELGLVLPVPTSSTTEVARRLIPKFRNGLDYLARPEGVIDPSWDKCRHGGSWEPLGNDIYRCTKCSDHRIPDPEDSVATREES